MATNNFCGIATNRLVLKAKKKLLIIQLKMRLPNKLCHKLNTTIEG